MKKLVYFIMPLVMFAGNYLERLNCGSSSPIYTTYLAAPERSDYFVDEGYHLVYYRDNKPLSLSTDTSGDFFLGFRFGKLFAVKLKDYYKKPTVEVSYPDYVQLRMEPFPGVSVRMSFFVWTSRTSLLEVNVRSSSKKELLIYLFYGNHYQSIKNSSYNPKTGSVSFYYIQPPKTWSQQKNLKGFVPERVNLVLSDTKPFSWGGYSIYNDKIFSEASSYNFLNRNLKGTLRAFAVSFRLHPGENKIRIAKATAQKGGEEKLNGLAKRALSIEMEKFIVKDRKIISKAPSLNFKDSEEKLLFLQGLYLARQQFYPSAGQFPHSYYVFSREPTWGWGHEGQVFHESLSMQALVLLDPALAMGSQRNFAAVQGKDGYLPYRVGAFFTRTFPIKGRKTTSAPFYSWTNWEIYKITKDKNFLKDAYRSGKAFAEYILRKRDTNKNGLLEWGGHVWLECVRDEYNAVWEIFGEAPDAPGQVEALDLSSMMVKEMRSLQSMAEELNLKKDSQMWKKRADRLSELINKYMWDPETGFYYHIHRDTMTFKTPDGKSLKRKEIIGFLPMWAGIASKKQAERLMSHLKNPAEFWRKFGVPTLSADDPYYGPDVLSCCRWNGPVWLTWEFLVFKGLLNYGYSQTAEELLQKIENAMEIQLRKNHRFWESYSPDYTILKSPKNYIWDSLISRMIYDLRRKK